MAKANDRWRARVSDTGAETVLGVKRAPLLLAAALFVLGCAAGCSSADARSAKARDASSAGTPSTARIACTSGQVREYYCDGLLPMSTAQGAPAPYESCPAGIEVPPGAYPRKENVARFDAIYTELSRQRAQPGHTCCYSWCSELAVADSSDVLPYAGCNEAGVLRENYCLPELEADPRQPGPAPLERCPLAIRPPEAVSFSVPKAAPLDVGETNARRQQGESTCCYGWCSRMPAGAR